MLVRAIILIIFGYLYSLDQNSSIFKQILTVGIFVAVGTIFLELLKVIIKALKLGDVRDDLIKSFNKAFMMLIPFVIFALVSKFYLRWEMVLAFFSTGIMTVGGVLSYELQGKIKFKKIFPLFITIYFSLIVFIMMNLSRILEKVGDSL